MIWMCPPCPLPPSHHIKALATSHGPTGRSQNLVETGLCGEVISWETCPWKRIMDYSPSSFPLILDLYGKKSFLCHVFPLMLHLVPCIKDLWSSNQDNKPFFFPVSCLVQVTLIESWLTQPLAWPLTDGRVNGDRSGGAGSLQPTGIVLIAQREANPMFHT